MSKKLLKQLDRIKLLMVKQDKVTINSWDITYEENLHKYEKKTSRFVVEDNEVNSPRHQRLKRVSLIDKKRKSNYESSASGNFSGLGKATSYKKLHEIIIEENEPDRLEFTDKNDGTVLIPKLIRNY